MVILASQMANFANQKPSRWWCGKSMNHMARADSAGHIDEQAGTKQAPPLVAVFAASLRQQSETNLLTRVMDSLKGLDQRMAALEQRAEEQERRAKAEEALALAEDIAEAAPQALLSALADRADRRLH